MAYGLTKAQFKQKYCADCKRQNMCKKMIDKVNLDQFDRSEKITVMKLIKYKYCKKQSWIPPKCEWFIVCQNKDLPTEICFKLESQYCKTSWKMSQLDLGHVKRIPKYI